MANAVAARLMGDDYQHLLAWLYAQELLMPHRAVKAVIVEDAKAVSADDLTLLRTEGAQLADRYHQIKFHVDHRRLATRSSEPSAKQTRLRADIQMRVVRI